VAALLDHAPLHKAQDLRGNQAWPEDLSPTCYAPTVLLEPPGDCRVGTTRRSSVEPALASRCRPAGRQDL
jgi:hypothetical protein